MCVLCLLVGFLTNLDLLLCHARQTNPAESTTTGDILFTWGANRNYVLGSGDGGDRVLPDKVHLKRAEKKVYRTHLTEDEEESESESGEERIGGSEGEEESSSDEEEERKTEVEVKADMKRFDSVGVREVVLAKLHTGTYACQSFILFLGN